MLTWALVASHDNGEIVWGVGWGDLLGGVIAGLIASAVVGALVWWWRRRRDRKDFGCLAGTYDATEKQPSEKPDGTVVVTGDGPVLTFVWRFGDGSVADGTLAMNEQSRFIGSGGYEHVRGRNLGWGQVTVIVASRDKGAARLLIDGQYTRQEMRDAVWTAWVGKCRASKATTPKARRSPCVSRACRIGRYRPPRADTGWHGREVSTPRQERPGDTRRHPPTREQLGQEANKELR